MGVKKQNKNHLLMPDCGSEHRFGILAYMKNTVLTDTEGSLSCVPIYCVFSRKVT